MKRPALTSPLPWEHYNAVFRPQLSSRRVDEVHDAQGSPVIKWPGFDNGDLSKKAHKQNGAYIAHAANAYPKLIAMLQRAALDENYEADDCIDLLKELGEFDSIPSECCGDQDGKL